MKSKVFLALSSAGIFSTIPLRNDSPESNQTAEIVERFVAEKIDAFIGQEEPSHTIKRAQDLLIMIYMSSDVCGPGNTSAYYYFWKTLYETFRPEGDKDVLLIKKSCVAERHLQPLGSMLNALIPGISDQQARVIEGILGPDVPDLFRRGNTRGIIIDSMRFTREYRNTPEKQILSRLVVALGSSLTSALANKTIHGRNSYMEKLHSEQYIEIANDGIEYARNQAEERFEELGVFSFEKLTSRRRFFSDEVFGKSISCHNEKYCLHIGWRFLHTADEISPLLVMALSD